MPKHAVALALAALALAPRLAAADPVAERANAVVADLGLHVVNVGYQRTVFRYLAAQVSAGLYGPWTVNKNVFYLANGERDEDVLGLVVRARHFTFIQGTAPTGLWVSSYLQLARVTATIDGE